MGDAWIATLTRACSAAAAWKAAGLSGLGGKLGLGLGLGFVLGSGFGFGLELGLGLGLGFRG